eukprot:scpid70915/ scgid28489/ 
MLSRGHGTAGGMLRHRTQVLCTLGFIVFAVCLPCQALFLNSDHRGELHAVRPGSFQSADHAAIMTGRLLPGREQKTALPSDMQDRSMALLDERRDLVRQSTQRTWPSVDADADALAGRQRRQIQKAPSIPFQKRNNTGSGIADAPVFDVPRRNRKSRNWWERRKRLQEERERAANASRWRNATDPTQGINVTTSAYNTSSISSSSSRAITTTTSDVPTTSFQTTITRTEPSAVHTLPPHANRRDLHLFGRTECERIPHYIDVTTPGCVTKRFDVGACEGFCRSWYLPIYVDEGVLPSSWFRRDKCKCCTHSTVQVMNVELNCEEARTVVLQVPRVNQCQCKKCHGSS